MSTLVKVELEICSTEAECDAQNKCDECCLVVGCETCGKCETHDELLTPAFGRVPNRRDDVT